MSAIPLLWCGGRVGAPAVPPTPDGNWLLWWRGGVDVYKDAIFTPASDGDGVHYWLDQTGNARHALGSDGVPTANPTYRTNQWNGQPYLSFNGSTQAISSPTDAGVAVPWTLFMVFDYSTDDGALYVSPTTTFQTSLRPWSSKTRINSVLDPTLGSGTTFDSTLKKAGGSPRIYAVKFNGASTVFSIISATQSGSISAYNFYGVQIGTILWGDATYHNWFTGKVGEVIAIQGDALTGDPYGIVAYLQDKFGAT